MVYQWCPVQLFNVSSPLTPPTPYLGGCERGCCCSPALQSSSCAIWFKVHYRCCRGRHTSPIQGSFIGTVLGRCSTVDDKGRGGVSRLGSPHFFPSSVCSPPSCNQFMSHVNLSPVAEVTVHFYHCERNGGV